MYSIIRGRGILQFIKIKIMLIIIDTNNPEQVAELLTFLKVRKQDDPIASPKPTPEARFAEIIEGLITKYGYYSGSISYVKGNDTYFEHNKYKFLWCDYRLVWSVFEKEYNMNYHQIQAFIKVQVEKHLNIKDVTPDWLTELTADSVLER